MYNPLIKSLAEQLYDGVNLGRYTQMNPDKIQLIKDSTTFLDENYKQVKLANRLYVIKNNINQDNLPLCKCGCERPRKLDTGCPRNGFVEYYQASCSSPRCKLDPLVRKLLDDKNWLYEQRVILKKGIKVIAKELGVSEIPVTNRCKEYGIHEIIDNVKKVSEDKIKILKDKKYLYNLYFIHGHTLKEIGAIIGVGQNVVKTWMDEHGIELKSRGNYDENNQFVSKEETEMMVFIKSNTDKDIVTSSRRIIDGKEIDVYVPKLKIGFEYNGIFHHVYRPNETEPGRIKDATYHLDKTTRCNNKNIQLIQIFSNEWNKHKDATKHLIRCKLCKNRSINSFVCKVKVVDENDKIKFLESNSLKVKDKTESCIGLYLSNILMAVLTFSENNDSIKIGQYQTKCGVSIIGGFKKLLHYVMYENSFRLPIFMEVDRRFSEGRLLYSHGFKLVETTPPAALYVDKTHAYIIEEDDLIKDQPYSQIFDCGRLIFKLEA